MSEHFNRLTPAEAELLAILAEEAGEIVQAVGKILRHGYESENPLDIRTDTQTGEGMSNRSNLEREIGDLDAVCGLLVEAGSIKTQPIQKASDRKREKLKQWTHHQAFSAKQT